MTPEEQRTRDAAISFARSNKKTIARRVTDKTLYLTEAEPVSVFMAGSPGAGKTEASIALLAQFGDTPILRIDPDELRSEFTEYTGRNAWLFQGGVSILVEKILDMALAQQQSFLLDGTLANYRVARSNIQRCLKRKRFVQVLYVYQEPMLAWSFVQARESSEGRRINPEHFVEQYFAARDVVNQIKVEFGKEIQVDLLLKNNDNTARFYKAGVDQIDYHIPEKHSRADLEKMISTPSG